MQGQHSDLNLAQLMVLHLQMVGLELMHDTSIQADGCPRYRCHH